MISSSGVIPVLKDLALCAAACPNGNNIISNNIHPGYLTSAHVELLQTCLAAGHYRYVCVREVVIFSWIYSTQTAAIDAKIYYCFCK